MQYTVLKQTKRSSHFFPALGIDNLLNDNKKLQFLKGKKVGLLANQSSVTSDFIPSAYALQGSIGSSLACLFTLEHGWSAFCAAGAKIKNTQESHTNLPVYSLYGPMVNENLKILQSLDILIIDIQDVGVRCYTYAASCAKILEYASVEKYSIEFIVCDRPNPLGNDIRGPLFNPNFRSLVSYTDVPFQHGKTIGSLLKEINNSLRFPMPLLVISSSPTYHPETHIWVPPSPGLPDWEAAFLYPGLVLLEGTNVSEGRGSSLPFKCVAAPMLDDTKIAEVLNAIPHSGIKARPFSFIPENGKLHGQLCQGVQLHVTDFEKINGLLIGVYLLHTLFHIYQLFQWDCSGTKYWIDELTGNKGLREAICGGKSPQDILASWELDIFNS